MYQVILLKTEERFERQQWAQAEALVEHDGVAYTLRAGPRQPLPTDHAWDEVAVYAPEEITEEEFQEWYERMQPAVEELRLRY